MKLKNYILGQWTAPAGEGIPQYHAITGEVIYLCGSEGIDFAEVMDYGRRTGGPALRKMTFQERGLMLKSLALFLNGIPLFTAELKTDGDSFRITALGVELLDQAAAQAASSIRPANASAEKPPNTTECGAPMRAQAARSAASGSDMPAAGSSRSRYCGRPISARAMATRRSSV